MAPVTVSMPSLDGRMVGKGLRRDKPRDVSGDGEPPAVAAHPHIGIAAAAGAAVSGAIRRPRVDDRDVAEHPDHHVFRGKAGNRDRPPRVFEERGAIEERPVGQRAEEIAGEEILEAAHVGGLHRTDVVGVELLQRVDVRSRMDGVHVPSRRRITRVASRNFLVAHQSLPDLIYATWRLRMTVTVSDRIEKKIVLKAPLARVWRAISDAGEFGEW